MKKPYIFFIVIALPLATIVFFYFASWEVQMSIDAFIMRQNSHYHNVHVSEHLISYYDDRLKETIDRMYGGSPYLQN